METGSTAELEEIERSVIRLDASSWSTQDDFYTSFFKAVGAPPWHGRNLDALNDSVVSGGINRIERPYSLVIVNYGKLKEDPRRMVDRFVGFFRDDLRTPVQVLKGGQ